MRHGRLRPKTQHFGVRPWRAALLAFALLLIEIGPAIRGAHASSGEAADAGATASDAGPLPAYALDLRSQARQIRALLAGALGSDVDPQSLFDVPLDASEEKLRVERERLELLSSRDLSVHDDPPDAGAAGGILDPKTLRARLDLDRARLAFYALPAQHRKQLLQAQLTKQQQAGRLDHDKAINQAEAEGRRAEQQRRDALEAARRSSTEAARLINEEHARLLSVTRKQSEYETAILQRRADIDTRNEAVLGWRRRVAALTAPDGSGTSSPTSVDSAYTELRVTLRGAREKLAAALGAQGDALEQIPEAGKDPLTDLPADLDRSVALKQRELVTAKAQQLRRDEQALETDETHELMTEVTTLNRLRLDLIGSLSPEKHDSILSFGLAGWNQAIAEVWQVALTLRYHLHAALDWLTAIRQGSERARSAWLAFRLALKWAFPIALFVWWRRRADGVLEAIGDRQRHHTRQDGDWFAVDQATRALAYLRRVRRPLEWLLLVGIATWLIPDQLQGLLEVRLLSRVLLWIFGGLFIVLAVDALGAKDTRQGETGTAGLRLRSLRLIGRAIVAFGLPLSATELLVGRGTVYHWVFSSCWFAGIPILFVIVSWWRPFIFERFTRRRKPNRFESWVLGNRSPTRKPLASSVSSLAAVAGGIYLFFLGAVRVVRSRILAFELTRRLLAYLFRRDLSKKARGTTAHALAQLPAEAFRMLGPEVTTAEPAESAADTRIAWVIERVGHAAGGAVAIVGERGSGKTTLLERMQKAGSDLIAVNCDADGLQGLKRQLNQALGLNSTADLAIAAQTLDRTGASRALLIDNAQHLIRPMMGGCADLDRVRSLFRAHSGRCTWVFAFDEAVWHFIERSRGSRPLFDEVIRLAPWSEESIVRLITQRNDAAGLAPDFSDIATELPENADELDLQEAIQRTEASYYRLLWDYAAGNPAVALHFWRRSLGVAPSGKVFVRLFDMPDTAQLETLPDSTAFVFRAIVQLGWSSAEDVVRVTSLARGQVEDALRYGNQHGYFDIREERYRVNWDWFRAVTRFLQRRHLSFS